jgi:threonine/homoserine/homoserine lactone efflux protein
VTVPVRLPAFLTTCWLLAMLPGAGQALILRQVVTVDRRAAWRSIGGTCTGILLWSIGAAAGLSTVLLANPRAYAGLRVAGGVVLAGLGIGSLRTMWRLRARGAGHGAEDDAEVALGGRGAYLAGLACNLGNPKAGVFAISLIPQFIRPEGHAFASGVLLGALWALTTAAWYLVFVVGVDRGRSVVTRPSVRTGLHAVTGVVLLLLGLGVALVE